jgi:prepilin-type N-terminal cleavage/methylation domain-containing protein
MTEEMHTDRARGDVRQSRGFTLIETSIALLVLLVAGLGAASLFMYSIKYNTGANDRAVAQAVAQRQMEVLRKTSFDQLATSTQDVTSVGRRFTVATTVCNDGSALCGGSTSVKRISVQVTPQSAGDAWARSSVTLVTLRSTLSTGSYF